MDSPDSYNIELTRNEMVALIKYHMAATRAIPKKYGRLALQLEQQKPAPKAWEKKMIMDKAKDLIATHHARAKGLLSLLPNA